MRFRGTPHAVNRLGIPGSSSKDECGDTMRREGRRGAAFVEGGLLLGMIERRRSSIARPIREVIPGATASETTALFCHVQKSHAVRTSKAVTYAPCPARLSAAAARRTRSWNKVGTDDGRWAQPFPSVGASNRPGRRKTTVKTVRRRCPLVLLAAATLSGQAKLTQMGIESKPASVAGFGRIINGRESPANIRPARLDSAGIASARLFRATAAGGPARAAATHAETSRAAGTQAKSSARHRSTAGVRKRSQ